MVKLKRKPQCRFVAVAHYVTFDVIIKHHSNSIRVKGKSAKTLIHKYENKRWMNFSWLETSRSHRTRACMSFLSTGPLKARGNLKNGDFSAEVVTQLKFSLKWHGVLTVTQIYILSDTSVGRPVPDKVTKWCAIYLLETNSSLWTMHRSSR